MDLPHAQERNRRPEAAKSHQGLAATRASQGNQAKQGGEAAKQRSAKRPKRLMPSALTEDARPMREADAEYLVALIAEAWKERRVEVVILEPPPDLGDGPDQMAVAATVRFAGDVKARAFRLSATLE
jgi:hypothetical protein